MDNDRLMRTIEMDCPICGQTHQVEQHTRETQMLIKDEPIHYEQMYFVCPDSRNSDYCEFVTAQVMDENLLAARNEYRKAHALLTSHEIKRIRSQYGLTQSEFSKILNLGEVTISRFETKAIQSKAMDDIIRAAGDDAKGFLRKLANKKDDFSTERYEQLQAQVICFISVYTRIASDLSITFSQLKEGILNKYKAFECYEEFTFSSENDLLPSRSGVSIRNEDYYTQARCEDNITISVAA